MKVVVDIDNHEYYVQRAYENIGHILSGNVNKNMEGCEARLTLVKEALVMLTLAEIKYHNECQEMLKDA